MTQGTPSVLHTGMDQARAMLANGGPIIELPPGVTYALLSQRHEDYDAQILELIEDLYDGGFQIQKKAKKYLIKLEGESDVRFAERCKIASYLAFFAQIVDQFTSDVFGQPLSVKPAGDAENPDTLGDMPDEEFYSEIEKNIDRRGTSFQDLMMCTLRTALKHRCALIIVDAPDDAGPPAANRAEEEARGTRRLYAYECPVPRLIDWRLDEESGDFMWAILYDRTQERETPFSQRDKVHETWTIWTITDGGSAAWVRYGIKYRIDQPPVPETIISAEANGATSFKRIPILRFELPKGLWVGNKVGPQAMEHWRRRSGLIGAQNRSMVAIPYVKRGPEMPAQGGPIPADIAGDQQRGNRPVATFNSKGWLELSSDDDCGFAEPEGKCYELIDTQLEKLREAMFQVTFQMAASTQRNSTAMGRSAMSKKKDEDLTARVLRALGHAIRQFAAHVFECISEARGEDVHWVPHGLDAYDSEDREQLLEEAVSLDQVAEAIPSETFHATHAISVMQKLLKGAVDPQTIAVIMDEIKKGIKDKHELNALMLEAQKEEILNPTPPAPTGPQAPQGKPPSKPQAKPPQQPANNKAA